MFKTRENRKASKFPFRIFLKHPEIKHLWKFAAALKNEDEMRESAQLKSHGKNVFEAINAAVNSLDKIDALTISLSELGYRHSMYGAHIEHFPVRPVDIDQNRFLIITSSLVSTDNRGGAHRHNWRGSTAQFYRATSNVVDKDH